MWDKPETYGVANKRVDVRTRKSAFNSRPRPAEVLLDNGTMRLIRRRQTFEDLLAGQE